MKNIYSRRVESIGTQFNELAWILKKLQHRNLKIWNFRKKNSKFRKIFYVNKLLLSSRIQRYQTQLTSLNIKRVTIENRNFRNKWIFEKKNILKFENIFIPNSYSHRVESNDIKFSSLAWTLNKLRSKIEIFEIFEKIEFLKNWFWNLKIFSFQTVTLIE